MIRPATVDDLEVIHTMIHEMATGEEAADQILTDKEGLRNVLFGPEPLAFVHIAIDDGTGEVVGYTLWSLVYSTWRGVGILIDDIHLRTAAVGRGVDTALLSAVAGVCAERDYVYMEWWARIGNEPASTFYESLGASRPVVQGQDLTVYRLSGKPLADLGQHG